MATKRLERTGFVVRVEQSIIALLLVLPGIAGLSACQPDPGRKHRAAESAEFFSDEGLTGGKLVLEENFDGPAFPAKLKPHPKAKVVEGWLNLTNIKNEPPVWVDFLLPERCRIEFDARARSDEGDLKVELFGNGNDHQSGYILVFGAHKNVEDWFARLDEHGKDRVMRSSSGVEKDKIYHFAIVRTDNRVRTFIDGKPFLMFDDAEPLRGKGHEYFAFNNWTAPVEFDTLRIFEL